VRLRCRDLVDHRRIDPFGGPTRPLDVVESVEKPDELAGYGLTLHVDDPFAFGSADAERERQVDRLKGTLKATGLPLDLRRRSLPAAAFAGPRGPARLACSGMRADRSPEPA
jgi:hypothetical protein